MTYPTLDRLFTTLALRVQTKWIQVKSSTFQLKKKRFAVRFSIPDGEFRWTNFMDCLLHLNAHIQCKSVEFASQ